MSQKLKIFLSVVLVCAVAFFVARVFWPSARGGSADGGKPPVKTSIKMKKVIVPASKKTKVPASTGPRMAIILDDWGMNAALVEDAVAVGRPLTLSVLPNLKHSRDIAQSAYAAGLGVMLHMPMQAKSLKAANEPHTIRTTSPDAEILKYLDEALESVPFVEGVNNHQGSAATSDLRVMRTVLSHLKQRGLFFVDSHVISTSVGRKVAEEVGIPFARRHIFLDNVATVEAVKKQLDAAIKFAEDKGSVVVIGHDKKPTLQALREYMPVIEKAGIKIVFVDDLLT